MGFDCNCVLDCGEIFFWEKHPTAVGTNGRQHQGPNLMFCVFHSSIATSRRYSQIRSILNICAFCKFGVSPIIIGNISQLHHRPFGADGDVGTVVVQDGASAINYFIIALYLRRDLLLYRQRWERNFQLIPDANIQAWDALPNRLQFIDLGLEQPGYVSRQRSIAINFYQLNDIGVDRAGSSQMGIAISIPCK